MKLIIDATEVAEQLADCQPGDEYTLVFTVDSKTDTELTGTATEVEHLEGEEEYAEEEMPAEESMSPQPARTKRVPKAIMVVAAK